MCNVLAGDSCALGFKTGVNGSVAAYPRLSHSPFSLLDLVFGKGSLLRNEPQYPTKGYAPHSGRGLRRFDGADIILCQTARACTVAQTVSLSLTYSYTYRRLFFYSTHRKYANRLCSVQVTPPLHFPLAGRGFVASRSISKSASVSGHMTSFRVPIAQSWLSSAS